MQEVKQAVLTVVVPHYSNEKGLVRCLESLKKMTPPGTYRAVVVDQSKIDHDWLITHELAHLVVKAYRPLGFAKACNYGLRLADTDYVMLCNDDVEFIYDQWWADVLSELELLPQASCVNPHSPRNPNGNGDMVNQGPYHDVLAGEQYTPEEIDDIKKTFQRTRYPGICMFAPVFKMQALLDLGAKEKSPYGIALLDESFGLGSGEDYDLCRRFGIFGQQCYGSARAIVWHWWGETKNNMPHGSVDTKEGQTTNHALISGGYRRMAEKWGPARHGPNPDQNPEGWDVQGHHGPKEPLKGQKWFDVVPL